MYASISPRRNHTDPTPYLWADGTRHASRPEMQWSADGARVLDDGAVYDPRPEHIRTPSNPTNPILDSARDSWDDDWGSALSWGFACCSVLAYLGEPVPDAYGYRASFAGPAADLADGAWETAETVAVLGLGTVNDDPDGPSVTLTDPDDVPAETWEAAARFAAHAAAVLDRVANAVPESDRY